MEQTVVSLRFLFHEMLDSSCKITCRSSEAQSMFCRVSTTTLRTQQNKSVVKIRTLTRVNTKTAICSLSAATWETNLEENKNHILMSIPHASFTFFGQLTLYKLKSSKFFMFGKFKKSNKKKSHHGGEERRMLRIFGVSFILIQTVLQL